MAQKAAAEKTRSPLEKPLRPSNFNTLPAPPPSKSPWASLPPLEKASPVEIAPQPTMPPPNRFGPAYGMPPTGTMQAPSPAREMSADDFNRAWRDGQSNQPRELFMPNSGRYEAVSEGRRRLSRNDQGFRAPAVLQRPSGTDPHGPAEPSAAFQTTRTSGDARRRTSSIVSGGSGQIARRLSMRSGDVAPPVFDNVSSDLSARPTSRDGSQSQVLTPAYQARHPSGDYMAAGGASFDIEAERERQKLMMKESGVRARQRRLDEEARLEAEKQERIKKKLAALEAAYPQPDQKPETPGEQIHTSLPAGSTSAVLQTDASSEAPRMTNSSSQSPPKPPQPLATGEPQQYGMIKVHALDSTKKMGMMEPQRPFASMRSDRESSDDTSRQYPPGPNGIRSIETPRTIANDSVGAPEPSPKLPKPATGPNGVGRGWGDMPARDHRGPVGSNLWGISSNKALGNGTFDQTLAGYAPQDLSRTSSGAPGWSNGRTPVSGRSPHVAEARMLSGSSLTSPDQGPLAADSEVDTLLPVVRPAPIGPPHQQAFPASSSMNNSPLLGTSNGSTLAAWNNFQSVAAPQERSENERLQRELASRKEEEQRMGVRRGPQYSFNETWKQVQLGEHPTQRDMSTTSQSTVPASFGAVGSIPTGPGSRGSRFFPSPGNQTMEGQRAATYSYPEPSRSPSPPPAEEFASAHPAFDGDMRHPAVRFPREKAVVKLPPMGPPTPPAEPQEMMAAESNQNLSWAARAAMAPPAQLRHASTPIAQTPSWQERFNGLFDKKPIINQKGTEGMAEPSPAVETSTREMLDVIPPVGASVSLPGHTPAQVQDELFNAVSKEVEDEEDLFEDRELASLPTISLPLQALVSLPLAQKPRYFIKSPEIASGDFVWNAHGPYAQYALIRTPTMSKAVKVTLPNKPGTSQNHPKYTKPLNKRGGSFARGGKSRGISKSS